MSKRLWEDYKLWRICDCYAAGLSYTEIAKDMETTKNAIAGLLHRMGYNSENRNEREKNEKLLN